MCNDIDAVEVNDSSVVTERSLGSTILRCGRLLGKVHTGMRGELRDHQRDSRRAYRQFGVPFLTTGYRKIVSSQHREAASDLYRAVVQGSWRALQNTTTVLLGTLDPGLGHYDTTTLTLSSKDPCDEQIRERQATQLSNSMTRVGIACVKGYTLDLLSLPWLPLGEQARR